MTSKREIATLRALLPPRPDPQTGQPFPSLGIPLLDIAPDPEDDPYRENRLSFKPGPPPGRSPVLAWHRQNRRYKIFGLVFSFVFLVVATEVISLLQERPPLFLLDLRMWPVWPIFIVGPLLMAQPRQIQVMSAGADWVCMETTRRRRKNVLNIYEIVKIRGSVGGGNRYLRLDDLDGYAMELSFTGWERDKRIWALVYNGIVHSVADGADIQLGMDKALGLDGMPAMRLNQHPDNPSREERLAHQNRPAVQLPAHDLAQPDAAETIRKSGALDGDPDLYDGCVWLERQDGDVIPVIWPHGYHARFAPVELFDQDGRLIAGEGDRVILTGAFRGADDTDAQLDHLTPELEEAFVAHHVEATSTD